MKTITVMTGFYATGRHALNRSAAKLEIMRDYPSLQLTEAGISFTHRHVPTPEQTLLADDATLAQLMADPKYSGSVKVQE